MTPAVHQIIMVFVMLAHFKLAVHKYRFVWAGKSIENAPLNFSSCCTDDWSHVLNFSALMFIKEVGRDLKMIWSEIFFWGQTVHIKNDLFGREFIFHIFACAVSLSLHAQSFHPIYIWYIITTFIFSYVYISYCFILTFLIFTFLFAAVTLQISPVVKLNYFSFLFFLV